MMKQMIERIRPGTLARSELPRRGVADLQPHVRWRRWRISRPVEPELLTSAELSECTCPDLCHRDHDND